MKFRGYIPSISKENEAAAWQHIAYIVKRALAQYPTTLEEDDETLEFNEENGNLTNNIRNCILFRRSEKIVLHFLQGCAEKVEMLLDMSADEAATEIQSWEKKEGLESYFKYTIWPLLYEEYST